MSPPMSQRKEQFSPAAAEGNNALGRGSTCNAPSGADNSRMVPDPLVRGNHMAPDNSFEALITQLRGGDNEAARQVFNRFAGQPIAKARAHLDARIRPKVDPEDVVQ